jgi:hypothetical protein
MLSKLLAVVVASVTLFGAAACGDDDDEAVDAAAPSEEEADVADGQVDVVLQEFSIETSAEASTTPVTFTITNEGYLPHQLVVLETELEYFSLPKNEQGGLDVTSAEIAIVADSGAIASGATGMLEADLEPGDYVLADPGSSFVSGGMRAPFSVEE